MRKLQDSLLRVGLPVRSNAGFGPRVYEGVVERVEYTPTRTGRAAPFVQVKVDRVDGCRVDPNIQASAGCLWDPIKPAN